MSEPKHTPGPWIRQISIDTAGELTTDINSKTDGHYNYVVASDVTNNANARLIAESPTFASLLLRAVEGRIDDAWLKETRAALKRADLL